MKARCSLLFLAAFLLASCQGEKKEKATAFQIYFTGDVNGRLEPCGCFTGQYGGMTRVDTWLGYHDPLGKALRVDIGDAIKGTTDFEQIHYHYLAEGFNKLNYAALNIGAREAALSSNELTELSARTKGPLVSANLRHRTSGELIFLPYRMVTSQGRRVAIIGLLDPDSVVSTLGEDLLVDSMETTLTNLLPGLEKAESPDLTLLLAFTTEPRMRELARQFYELDVILGGDVSQPSQDLIRENESLILFITNQARAVGDLKFNLEGKRASDPVFDIHLMEDSIPQSAEMLALSGRYREFIRQTVLKIDQPGRSDNESLIPGVASDHQYVGSATCGACHPTAMKVWQQSGHSHAFDTLVKGGTDADPGCVQCHTIGFGEASGYLRSFGKEKLTDVGCESCHGPGSEHIRQRALGDPSKITFQFRPLGKADCTRCHHGEFSRPFKWEEFWPLIQHGKEKAGL